MEETTEQLHAIVHGLVQGVSFRHYTVLAAYEIGLVGWVRNNPDGTVEVVAEGTRTQLDRFLQFLHRGSPAARVKSVTTEWRPAQGQFSTFQVAYFRN